MRSIEQKNIEYFKTSSDYVARKGIVHDEDVALVKFIRNVTTFSSTVLEIGGGSGYFLDLIQKDQEWLVNCEFVPHVYKKQIGNSALLVGGSGDSLPFRYGVFDVVITKNLMHHLIGQSRKESKNRSKNLVSEISHVLKGNGHVVILELIGRKRIFSFFIFYFCMILTLLDLELGILGLKGKPIVSFLSEKELGQIVSMNHLS